MFIEIRLAIPDAVGGYAGHINTEHICGVFADKRGRAMLKMLGQEKYLLLEEPAEHFLLRLAALTDTGNKKDDTHGFWASRAAQDLLEELDKAAQSMIYNIAYEDTASKARSKLKARFNDIVSEAIDSAIQSKTARSTHEGEPKSS